MQNAGSTGKQNLEHTIWGVGGEEEGDGLKESPSGEGNECPVCPYLFWKHAVLFLDFSLVNQRN